VFGKERARGWGRGWIQSQRTRRTEEQGYGVVFGVSNGYDTEVEGMEKVDDYRKSFTIMIPQL
jgi:bisphosphoglycerate-dependent phosphoglycerate mutase